MDSLTHIITGAFIGELFLGNRLGKKAMFLGAVASSFPDIDVVANYFYDSATAAFVHRGITHSVFFALAGSWLFSKVFEKKFLKQKISFTNAFRFFITAFLCHDVLDLFTCYGTGLLEPFSYARFTMNNFFVADLFFTIPLLFVFILLLAWKKTNVNRIKALKIAGLYATIYFIFSMVNKYHVNTIATNSLREADITYNTYMTTPAPLNNFLWYVVAENKRGCYVGYYSIFDSQKKIVFDFVPKNDLMMITIPENEKVNLLKRFSNGYYQFSKSGDRIYFNDLRFGRAAGWALNDSRYVFSYSVSKESDNVELLNRRNLGVSRREAFHLLVKRIKGN